MRNKRRQKPRKRFWQRGMAAAAAVLVIAVMISTMLPFGKVDIVYAMEQAFREVEAYHGVLEIVSTSAEGSRSLRSKLEVWADKRTLCRKGLEDLAGRHYYGKQRQGKVASTTGKQGSICIPGLSRPI